MDFYVLSGIERGAELGDINGPTNGSRADATRTSTRAIGRQPSRFRQIAAAYETLSDPDRRRRYDVGG